MVKHLVFWNIKDDLDFDGVYQEMKIRVEALNGEIPGLIKVELGRNFNGGKMAYDIGLYSELDSREALEVYRDHPKHVFVKEFISAVTKDVCVVDYEVKELEE